VYAPSKTEFNFVRGVRYIYIYISIYIRVIYNIHTHAYLRMHEATLRCVRALRYAVRTKVRGIGN